MALTAFRCEECNTELTLDDKKIGDDEELVCPSCGEEGTLERMTGEDQEDPGSRGSRG